MSSYYKRQLKQYQRLLHDRVFDLSKYTVARIGLGHTGGHLKIKDWLNFQASFAQAKDAVHNSSFDTNTLVMLANNLNLKTIAIQSQALDHAQFLLRPDLGGLLAVDSQCILMKYIRTDSTACNKDLLILISGGLSPVAIQKQIPLFLPSFIHQTRQESWSIAPLLINPKGRVALGDQANHYFKAKVVIMLIGERPGLSIAESMGIYITYNAKPGCTNDQRNCISNIHSQGLSHDKAAIKLSYFLKKAMAIRYTGVELKDDFLKS